MKKLFAVFLIFCFILSGCATKKGVPQSDDTIESSSPSSTVSVESSQPESIISQAPSVQAQGTVYSSAPQTSSKKPTSSATTPSQSVSSQSPPPQATASKEMRAMWFTYIEFAEILKGKTKAQFKSNIEKCFDNCVESGLNAVVVQVRSNADALYPSEYFPTSVHFTGNRTNSAPFDAMKIMIDAAHERNMEFHAWVNPFRGPRLTETNKLAPNDPIKTYASMTYQHGNFYYLDPGFSEIRQLIVNGIVEIVSKYDVDGIHFDDRFYPEHEGDYDAASFNKYSAGRTKKQFRLDNVNALVKDIYTSIKKIKNIPFGVSPQGNLNNNYYSCYCDVKLWSTTAGYVDYMAPQLYWNYNEGTLPFEQALSIWQNLVTAPGVKLIIGLAPYKIGADPEWMANEGDILKRQIVDIRKSNQYGGFIMFRYHHYMSKICETERANVKDLLARG